MTHKNLEIWQLGIDLVEIVYRSTQKFPKAELYGLSAQMRRSAISYPSNIAEGAARKSHREYLQFLYISLGSLAELETQVLISERIGYIQSKELFCLIEMLRKKHLNFIKYIKTLA